MLEEGPSKTIKKKQNTSHRWPLLTELEYLTLAHRLYINHSDKQLPVGFKVARIMKINHGRTENDDQPPTWSSHFEPRVA